MPILFFIIKHFVFTRFCCLKTTMEKTSANCQTIKSSCKILSYDVPVSNPLA
jgi:hypothetical protein